MAPTVPGDDTLIFFGERAHRDHIRLVGLLTLYSRLSDGMDLASVSFALRIIFLPERSENLTKEMGASVRDPL